MDVIRFAEEQGIAPSIVVGRLQHEGLVPWNRLESIEGATKRGGNTSLDFGFVNP